MTALNMTADEALALADQWCAGLTMDADSKGWGAILLVLAEEVRRLRMELAHEEQRVADMMDAVNRVGHEIERLRADAARLDWLDQRNAALNARYGTVYRWKVILSPNIVRLMVGRHDNGHVGDVDLNDANANGLPSCRDAIDEAMREHDAARSEG